MGTLIDKNLISIEAKLNSCPQTVDIFTPILIDINVYLLKASITRPITNIIDSGSSE